MSRLKITYEKEIISKLMSKLSLKNKHDVPKLIKEKRLLPAEYGYYQAFAEKNGKGFINFQGGMVIARHKFGNKSL